MTATPSTAKLAKMIAAATLLDIAEDWMAEELAREKAEAVIDALVAVGFLVDFEPPVKTFYEAHLGDHAYTWQNSAGEWGEYMFETTDPFETHDRYDLAEISPITRKRWQLVEIVEIEVPRPEDDAE